ncbi:3-hydroxyacyl-[acyl-carrier-protein] dehydratase FabZ [Clostridia bacterium]|nr:3-hydroxyacyl-[acyl-carrier-protein] dehydratase FabZ [Clostridia bacterium]
MELDIEQIKEIIPHRDPFLLIDGIEEMEPGVSVTAVSHIKPDADWFRGHFPGNPVTPGVLLLEMMAQAGACCMLALPGNKGKVGYFGGVKEAKFRRMVLPGDTVVFNVEIIKIKANVGIGKGIATVNGEKALTAEISFIIS